MVMIQWLTSRHVMRASLIEFRDVIWASFLALVVLVQGKEFLCSLSNRILVNRLIRWHFFLVVGKCHIRMRGLCTGICRSI
ncbi:hypothetical protein BpHYR1_019940 [Brachionus plicatilis]|uniref:Uncharacterized protein n=1 Tax=Brachionus plicatilis TaxID=10195 RepID=A0A3M7T381_BRAPC|nr:hypothetical protein BpHYR1_019940 [Brachionus plicatilis]